MALNDEQRLSFISSLRWSFTPIQTRASLVGLGVTDGKTLAQAATYAATYGGGFESKDPEERRRIAQFVSDGSGGVLDALVVGGAGAPHTKIAALNDHQWQIARYLLQNGETVAAAINGAAGVVASKVKQEAVLYFLLIGQDLATAKTSAGVE